MKIRFLVIGITVLVFAFSSCAQDLIEGKIIPIKTPGTSTYQIDTTGCINGSISCEPSKPFYADGETVRVTAIPSSGYLFNSWTGSNSTNPQTFELKISANTKLGCVFLKRKWTCVVYMAADNDLERDAINDINEMEAVDYSGMPVTVLVLIDRSPGYDQTNGNWTDTRLYEIKSDTANTTINSKRIACGPLGLTTTNETELDMADPINLSYLLTFAKESYPADEYALIMWGHGSGWRGAENGTATMIEPVKAVSVDDTSGTFMSISKANSAVKDKGFTTIAFDTCFAALLEIAFEFRTSAHWLIGSEGVTSSNGWDYAALFATFKNTGYTDSDFSSSVLSQFRDSYSVTPNASISVIDLTKAGTLKDRFDAFGSAVATKIIDSTSQQNIRDILINECDLIQVGGVSTRDVFIDIPSMRSKLSTLAGPSATSALSNAITEAVTDCWSASGDGAKKIGVNFITFFGKNTPQLPHQDGYIRGKSAIDQSEFVRTSTGWVPNYALSANSLLDMVFYKSF